MWLLQGQRSNTRSLALRGLDFVSYRIKTAFQKAAKNNHTKTSVSPRALWCCPTSAPKTKPSPSGPRAVEEKPGPDAARAGYSLGQLLLRGRVFEASEFFARFDLIELGPEDRLLILPEPFLPPRSLLLLEESALLPDLFDPVFFII